MLKQDALVSVLGKLGHDERSTFILWPPPISTMYVPCLDAPVMASIPAITELPQHIH